MKKFASCRPVYEKIVRIPSMCYEVATVSNVVFVYSTE